MGQDYYLGIDVGASKTLFAVFTPEGEMVCERKIKTNPDYEGFKNEVASEIRELSKRFHFSHCCCALPGWFDFKTDTALAFGNLKWQNIKIKNDLEAMMPGVKVLYHNDAKLAGLSEAVLLHKKYRKVLYVTLSTGIGGGVIIDDVIDNDFANFEPGQMLFEYGGKRQKWEAFASGKALKERYGKMASEIEDEATWREYTRTLVVGFEDLLATIQPDAVVIGGGVGTHFDKFKPFLEEELAKINNPLVPTPPLLRAQRPEEAVIYGCYDYIKQNV
ncbi:MAG TPA: ROK family protein [Candidatus Saccharimonadales bacterium]|nr:ROK family protein [Candidatus Saccharimonadales bacterium]